MSFKFDYRGGEQLDASLGLIMRLNGLWYEADGSAKVGNYHQWNIVLDCIFRNLCFKESLEVEDEEGRIINVKLCRQDEFIFNSLNQKVKDATKKFSTKFKNKEEYCKAKDDLYAALQIKDIGLRKFMSQLKLYLKQGSGNPANAMWGG